MNDRSETVAMSAPDLDDSDVAAVVEVLESGRLALGPRTAEFEARIAEYVGARHAVAVSSGTAALHLILESLGIGEGDEVLVPSFTFAASVNVILHAGATPVFVEIDEETYTLDVRHAERNVTPRTRAVLAVDVFGHPAEWTAILDLASRHRLRAVDDSCEALGAEYRGTKLGRFGDAAAFAFYPNKQITTGEGGVLVTGDAGLAARARSLRNQGRGEMGPWLVHDRLGYNYRMDEMSAALGVSQLRRIETILDKRERVARMYERALAGVPHVRPPFARADVRVSRFVYVVRLDAGLDRDAVMREMERRGIPVRAYFPPLHLQPYVRERFGFRGGELPVTEAVAARTLALPFHANLGQEQVDRVVDALSRAIGTVGAG